MIDRVRKFLRGVFLELKKVSTMSRKETIASTLVVIVTVFVISLFLGIVDIGLSKVIGVLIR